MKKPRYNRLSGIILVVFLILICTTANAADTCIFALTADDVPPNVVILLDNGAAMEQIIWHPDYDNSADYTPTVSNQKDFVE